MTDRDYPAERIKRYVTALNNADTYAQLSTLADRERLARAAMAVADAETDPVYKSGYDTGRMHEGTKALREAARELRDGNTNWTDDTAAQTADEVAEWLDERALAREKNSPELTVYRAEHGSGMPLCTYTNLKAAQKHCEAYVRREHPSGDALVFDWIPDDEEDTAIWELVAQLGEEESTTGYCVAAVDVTSEYDEGADE